MAGAQDHPPLLADEQEEKRDQARDECQADPDDGPGVVAGPCRGEPGAGGGLWQGWGGCSLSALASGPGLWWPSGAWRAASSAMSQPRVRAQATASSGSTCPLLSFPFKTLMASQHGATTSWGCVTWGEVLDFSEPPFSHL